MAYHKLAAAVCLVTAVSLPSLTESASIQEVRVTGVRAYADGNMHVFLAKAISAACGDVLRVRGPGKEDVRAIALAALMSGRSLNVESTDTKEGNFCNLTSIRVRND